MDGRPPTLTTGNDQGSTPQWLPLSTASPRVGKSVKTLRRWIQAGKIPAQKVDGAWQVNISGVEVPATVPGPSTSTELQPLLSTIHELSRDLGEARERAARAEQISEHLRERLTELRTSIEAEQTARRRWWRRQP